MIQTGRSLTRADLAAAINSKTGCSGSQSAMLVDQILKLMCGALHQGKHIKIASFGTFTLRDKRERIGRNPKTGSEAPISGRRVVTFRASLLLKDRLASG